LATALVTQTHTVLLPDQHLMARRLPVTPSTARLCITGLSRTPLLCRRAMEMPAAARTHAACCLTWQSPG